MSNIIQLQNQMIKMGLGEALTRKDELKSKIDNGTGTKKERKNWRKEYELIMEALNSIELSIGMNCQIDPAPVSEESKFTGRAFETLGVNIFETSAKTSCCRISSTPERKKKTSSRQKKTSRRR